MSSKASIEHYKHRYAKLLRLYPRAFQERFASPMQQTFNDMCNERIRAGQDIGQFARRIYLETVLEISKEHIREGIVRNKRTKTGIFIIVAVLAGVVGTLATLFIINLNRSPSIIAPGSYLEEARKLSTGKKDACLADSQNAIAAVRKDDDFLDEDETYSKFEMTASLGIVDVPAGTNYKITIQRYDGTLAQGAIKYEGDYGAYNYTIEKTVGKGEWRFVSMTACTP